MKTNLRRQLRWMLWNIEDCCFEPLSFRTKRACEESMREWIDYYPGTGLVIPVRVEIKEIKPKQKRKNLVKRKIT